LRAVKFIGSTPGGKKVAEVCGKNMKKGAFELGGSDPFIVFEDADIDLATSKAIVGRLHTNGQACNNSKRFIVHEAVYDEFVESLTKKLKDYVKIGDPMDQNTTIGPLSMEK
jgi:succinate-semialdehyde dehydrogenase/glutarate-semialdehyde dehydrogenase